MARWQEGAAGRLQAAALRLYAERGYEQTTVADIASEAGVTARTFFRHYADKREVLFAGSERLRDGMLAALEAAPATATPMEAVAAALDASTVFLGRDHEHSRLRMSVIFANAELLERELIKMASIAAAMAEGLRRRGVPARDASLAAETGTVVLRVAFEQWVAGPPDGSLPDLMRATLVRLTEVTAAR
ncbi:AcrR family transcriptional regulator [Actinoplanes tereljensis]|uniref:TetR family transcriptional regulator n=1 Tax=Paractinoplanes tereljensis TaxID=571912 RepID=A0A919TS43_9ACTN|nr:TetR/AcrR family transcriptional regulator [Actinoplanes tereljensis]GIF18682.1 TetR family transcriptional regulator [Actinoplanes tereljensis]